MKNPNSLVNRLKRNLAARWSAEDYPGAEPRFQILLLAKDIVVFLLLPIMAIVLFKACENASIGAKRSQSSQRSRNTGAPETKSYIIEFRSFGASTQFASVPKRAPGALVRVKLLNVVETYTNAPVPGKKSVSSAKNSVEGARAST